MNKLIAEKMFVGRFAGSYRVYDETKPEKTLDYVTTPFLSQFFDSCIFYPQKGIKWDCCEVKDGEDSYTVHFDLDYKKALANELIAKLIALNTGTDLWCAQDVVDECEAAINEAVENDCGFMINPLIRDYLGLYPDYAWVFSD